jgi:hypothetical protein
MGKNRFVGRINPDSLVIWSTVGERSTHPPAQVNQLFGTKAS